MIKIKFSTVLIWCLSLLFLVGCATNQSDDSVAVVDNLGSDYPRELFLTAQGQGDTEDQAQESARLNLALIFSVQISVDQRSFRQLITNKSDISEQVTISTSQIDNIRQQTNQLIEGIEVISKWDAVSGTYQALAILERAPAASRLRNRINELNQQTNIVLKEVSGSNALRQLNSYYQAWQAQLLVKSRREQLAIVTNSILDRSKWQPAALRQQMFDIARNIAFVLEFDKHEAGYRKLIESALGKAGFERLHSTTPQYRLVVSILFNEPFKRDGWYWQTASLKFSLEDLTTFRSYGGWQWNFKESSTEKNLLESRISASIADKMEKNVINQIIMLSSKKISL